MATEQQNRGGEQKPAGEQMPADEQMRADEQQQAVLDLAAEHELELDPDSLEFNEMGLDYRVVLARTRAGDDWILRIPRRSALTTDAEAEQRILTFVGPRLPAAVPQWQVHSPRLIAYPELPGTPGLTLDAAGQPQWHIDPDSLTYAASLGELLAGLHQIDTEAAASAGIQTRTPTQIRQGWHDDLERVRAEFDVADDLVRRWSDWLAEDSYWPSWSVLTHGEMYAAHTLVADEQIVGVLDWSTAAVDDPARDFIIQQATGSDAAFETLIQRYAERGGRVWPRMAEHCAELFAANPLSLGRYALRTGSAEHLAAAQAELSPSK